MTRAQNDLVKHLIMFPSHSLKQSHAMRPRRRRVTRNLYVSGTGRPIDVYEDTMNVAARWRGCVVRALVAMGTLEWRDYNLRLVALSHRARSVR